MKFKAIVKTATIQKSDVIYGLRKQFDFQTSRSVVEYRIAGQVLA